jgi:hypothetical protein
MVDREMSAALMSESLTNPRSGAMQGEGGVEGAMNAGFYSIHTIDNQDDIVVEANIAV